MKKRKVIKKLRAALGEAATKILAEEGALAEELRDQETMARARRWLELSQQGERR